RQHPHLHAQQLGQPGWPGEQGRRGPRACHHRARRRRGALTVKGACALLLASLSLPGLAAGQDWARLPGGEFNSVLRYEDTKGVVRVAPFELQRRPVTNAQFLDFVRRHPQWRRGEVPELFAEQRYLQHWAGPTALGE